MDTPLITIGLPTYNRASRLRGALDNLLAQTYPHLEIIISDNASRDGTRSICEEYAARDARIRYVRQEENIGQLANFRFVINEAQGEYFLLASDDDWRDPKFVATLKAALEAHPRHGVCMSSFARVYEDGEKIGETCFVGVDDMTSLGFYETFRRTVQIGRKGYFFIYGLFRTSIIQKFMSRPFPDCVRFDHVLMGEAALMTHFCSVPEVLFSKTIYRGIGMAERYEEDPAGRAYAKKRGRRYLWYLASIFWRIVSSPWIPLHRKAHFVVITFPVASMRMVPMILLYGFPRINTLLKLVFFLKAPKTHSYAKRT